jgi:hypothetical protein
MKIDQDIIDEALKEGMPPKPMPKDFSDEESFEEAFGYWMGHFGKVLALRQQAKNQRDDHDGSSF